MNIEKLNQWLVLGDSAGLNGFIPEVFKQRLGQIAANYCMVGSVLMPNDAWAMSKYIELEGSEETPHIILDKANGKFTFTGRSLPEDAARYYEPIQAWFKEYINEPNNETDVVFELEYHQFL